MDEAQDLSHKYGESEDSRDQSSRPVDSDCERATDSDGDNDTGSEQDEEDDEGEGEQGDGDAATQRDPGFETSRNTARSGPSKKRRANPSRSDRFSAAGSRAANTSPDIEKPPTRYDPPDWSASPPPANPPYMNLYGQTPTTDYVFGAPPGSAVAAAQNAAAELKRMEERRKFLAESSKYGDTEAGMFKAFQKISDTGREDIMKTWREAQKEETRRKKISEAKRGSTYTLRKEDDGDGGDDDGGNDYEPKRGSGRPKRTHLRPQPGDGEGEGEPSEEDEPEQPVKRGRGRPRGTRNKRGRGGG